MLFTMTGFLVAGIACAMSVENYCSGIGIQLLRDDIIFIKKQFAENFSARTKVSTCRICRNLVAGNEGLR